jgi:hypothetical protein
MGRLILAMLAGFILNVVLSMATDHLFHVLNVYPPYGEPMFDNGLMLLAFSYRVIFTVGCCYLTAMLAREQAMKAVLIMGGVGSVLWLLGAIAMWDKGPAWYNIVGIITSVPLAWLGGKLYVSRQASTSIR